MPGLSNSSSPVPGRFNGLDHLRALAIILVFFYHYQLGFFGHPDWVTDCAKFGWTGVDLFFVLSGFLISSQLFTLINEGKMISYKTFFLKRAFRILPAYWVVVAIYFCFPAFHEKEHLPPLWRFLAFTQNFGMNIRNYGTFSHAWSLCVEEHFYFFLPLILIFLQRTRLLRAGIWLLPALFLAGFMIRNYSWNHFYLPAINGNNAGLQWGRYIYCPTYNRLDGFLSGVGAAALFHFRPDLWNKISRYGNQLIMLSVVWLAGAYFLCYDEHSYAASVFGFPVVAVGYGLMVAGAISPSGFLYKWRSKLTMSIAAWSYALYLVHKGIIHMTQQAAAGFGIDKNGNLVLLMSILFCVLGAVALRLVVERPMMQLRNKLVDKTSGQPAVAVVADTAVY
jgi:peptidoglycan/LPS O-acetylase OafA/YrhL